MIGYAVGKLIPTWQSGTSPVEKNERFLELVQCFSGNMQVIDASEALMPGNTTAKIYIFEWFQFLIGDPVDSKALQVLIDLFMPKKGQG